ncbi:unnamed protein product [Ectocarpus sp. CCAP 1310/34]|nr:unnamed protein product [Ectocarpus sp. CCAP 1310/34]
MSDRVDLTADSEDDELQAAIRESLSSHSGSSGATSAAGNSLNSDGGMSRSKRPASEHSDNETPSQRNGKRPRSFQPFEKPPLYRLLSTSPSDRASTGSVGLDDLLSGDFESALLCNYMVDYALLVRSAPRLGSVPVTIVHGFKPGTQDEINLRSQCAVNPGVKLRYPELPEYGTNHAKMIILKFSTGIRVVVLTANFIVVDVTDKSQGVWYQDFPKRTSGSCAFQEDLMDFLFKVGGPASAFASTLGEYDFRAARVALVPSVPGTGGNTPGTGGKPHKGKDLHKYGHMRVRALLSREKEDGTGAKLKEGGHKVLCQISSLASLTKTPNRWLSEILTSFMPLEDEGKKAEPTRRSISEDEAQAALLEQHLRVVWPSVEAVRTSSQGWIAGGSICCNTVNMYGGKYKWPNMNNYRSNTPLPELRPLLRKWMGNPAVNRTRDAPHIKSYLRYREVAGENGAETRVDGDEVAWFLLTSSNLSRSAWGYLNKASTVLTVRSFEMGVMFLPSLLRGPSQDADDGNDAANASGFTCTPGEMGLTQRFPLSLGYDCEAGKGLPLSRLPLPYVLPAPRYDFDKSQDANERPWVWDQDQSPSSLDRNGEAWQAIPLF